MVFFHTNRTVSKKVENMKRVSWNLRYNIAVTKCPDVIDGDKFRYIV